MCGWVVWAAVVGGPDPSSIPAFSPRHLFRYLPACRVALAAWRKYLYPVDGLRLQPGGGGIFRAIRLDPRFAGKCSLARSECGFFARRSGRHFKVKPLRTASKKKISGSSIFSWSRWPIGNIDISQANPLVEGLLLFAIAAVYIERWNSAAVCVAIATYFKIYPIAVGLLICVIAPRRFSWRMLVALLLLLLIPFLFQHWSYVSSQYHAWIATRTSDDRRQWPIEKLPLDLWFLIHWVWHLPIPPKIYSLIQLGTAGALALFCAVQTWRGWAKNRDFDRPVLPRLHLDDSLRTGHGILYLFDSGAGNHSRAGSSV